MADPNISELLSTTLQLLEDEIVDNVTNDCALTYELKTRDMVKPWSGGPTIQQSLEYAENVTYKRYSGWETLDITPSTVFSAATFQPKQVAISVSISGLEELQNAGRAAKFDLIESRIKNAQHTFANNFETDLFSDGTGSAGKQITGLQLAVADDPTTGTYGAIDRATWTFWANQYQSCAAGDGAASVSTIQANMNRVWRKIVVKGPSGKVAPTLLIGGSTYFGYYESSLMAIQRITSEGRNNKFADAGFQSYMFKTAPYVLSGTCSATRTYFLNGNYLYLRPHKDRNMKTLAPDRYATNQDGYVRLIGWAGNLTCANCRVQGVLIA